MGPVPVEGPVDVGGERLPARSFAPVEPPLTVTTYDVAASRLADGRERGGERASVVGHCRRNRRARGALHERECLRRHRRRVHGLREGRRRVNIERNPGRARDRCLSCDGGRRPIGAAVDPGQSPVRMVVVDVVACIGGDEAKRLAPAIDTSTILVAVDPVIVLLS